VGAVSVKKKLRMADIINELDLWLQLQTAVAAHILDLVKRNQNAIFMMAPPQGKKGTAQFTSD
jgi:hypothetical protein